MTGKPEGFSTNFTSHFKLDRILYFDISITRNTVFSNLYPVLYSKANERNSATQAGFSTPSISIVAFQVDLTPLSP